MKREVIDALLKGNIDILLLIDENVATNILMEISVSSMRDEIVSKCFSKLKDKCPKYALFLVCDLEEYKEFSISYLESDVLLLANFVFLFRFINTNTWINEFLAKNILKVIGNDEGLVEFFIQVGVEKGSCTLLKSLLYCENMFIRGKAMYELLYNYAYLFFDYYPNVTEYMVKKDSEGNVIDKIDILVVSRIAYLVLDSGLGRELYEQIKEFIFINYEKNYLASCLLGRHMELGEECGNYEDVILYDLNRYFLTSIDYKYELYRRYGNLLDDSIRNEFGLMLEPFIKIDEEMISHIFEQGLGDAFLDYVTKYLELSTGAKVIEDLGRGSSTRSIRIGDYVIKCSETKWDLSDNLPKLFLFAPDYEFVCKKNKEGKITGALEVQKYYRKAVSRFEKEIISNFFKTLKRCGYKIDDLAFGHAGTSNLFHLDSYRETNIDNVDLLPEWFKKDPVVWVDIDMIHKLK